MVYYFFLWCNLTGTLYKVYSLLSKYALTQLIASKANSSKLYLIDVISIIPQFCSHKAS